MLNKMTSELLHTMHLSGMATALEDQRRNSAAADLPFEDRFGLIVDAEFRVRENRRLQRILKHAKLKEPNACAEDIDFSASRGLDKQQILSILSCEWVEQGRHILLTGPTGVGKTWLACSLGNQAARKGFTVLYKRLSDIVYELDIARADGSLPKFRTALARTRLLILDDWGIAILSNQGRHDLLEVIDDRVPGGSVIITSQMPVDKWHEYLGEPTVADAILDRVTHNSHKIQLKGESMRRSRTRKQGK